jgi:hypothetical protein
VNVRKRTRRVGYRGPRVCSCVWVFVCVGSSPSLEAACKRYSEADAGPGAEAGAGFRDYKNSFGSICVAASVRPGSGRVHEHDAGLSPCARNKHHPRTAVREAISRDTSSSQRAQWPFPTTYGRMLPTLE